MSDKPRDLDAIVHSQMTVADKIRALSTAGLPRAEIGRRLGKRYQHVRNVLEGDAQTGGGGYVLGRADLSGVSETSAAPRVDEESDEIDRRGAGAFWLRLRPDGSLPLPPEVLAALQAEPGLRVFAQLRNGRLEVISADAAMEEARQLVCRIVPPSVDLADSLLADRREEAARERDRG